MTRRELREARRKLDAEFRVVLDEMDRAGHSWDTYAEYMAACYRAQEIIRAQLALPTYRGLAQWNRENGDGS